VVPAARQAGEDVNVDPAMPNALPGLAATAPAPRLLSIDALRGFDMFWIIGGAEVVKALAEWGNWSFKNEIDDQLEHVPWEGFHFYDLIFPLFLFVIGAVVPFSIAALRQRGESNPRIYWRILRRAVLLFALGLLYNRVLQLDFQSLRVAGVLQRLAICYGVAAIIVLNVGWRGQFVCVATILLGYWALLAFVAAPGSSPGDYSKEGNLCGYVDRHYLPGKIYDEYYGYGDNEGLLSTIPALATALIGALAGQWLRSGYTPARKLAGLILAGAVCLAAGFAWGQFFPIIKNLWTSSYVLVAGGWSLLLLAFFYGVIDVVGWRGWAFFFIVIGSNAIVIYVAPKFIDFNFTADFLLGGLIARTGSFQPVAAAIAVLSVKWLMLLYLYRKRLFLRV
jgi:predicted acyltransferase